MGAPHSPPLAVPPRLVWSPSGESSAARSFDRPTSPTGTGWARPPTRGRQATKKGRRKRPFLILMQGDWLLQRHNAAPARRTCSSGRGARPRTCPPILPCRCMGRRSRCQCVAMRLVTKIDIQRFCAEQPADIVDKLDAATEHPARLEVIVLLAEWRQYGTENACDVSAYSPPARCVDKGMFADCDAEPATHRSEPVDLVPSEIDGSKSATDGSAVGFEADIVDIQSQ